MHYVNLFFSLLKWDVRGSGYLQVWFKALSTGASFCFESTLHWSLTTLQLSLFSKNPVSILFLLFSNGRILSTAFNNLISFTVALCYPNSESLCLPPERKVSCLHTTSATMGFCLPLSHHVSFYPSLCRGQPFSYVIHCDS